MDVLHNLEYFSVDEIMSKAQFHFTTEFPNQTLPPTQSFHNKNQLQQNILAIKTPSKQRVCWRCSQNHKVGQCPAYNLKCPVCEENGHLQECCPVFKFQQKQKQTFLISRNIFFLNSHLNAIVDSGSQVTGTNNIKLLTNIIPVNFQSGTADNNSSITFTHAGMITFPLDCGSFTTKCYYSSSLPCTIISTDDLQDQNFFVGFPPNNQKSFIYKDNKYHYLTQNYL